jgi:serine/threonine protein kinase
MRPQERYQLIQEIVEAALKLEPNHRPAYLAQACAGDEALRHEVESLLAAEAQADGFLNTPAPAKYAYVLESKDEEPTIFKGRYATERKLNQGGFGVLYLASDRNLHSRLVAVKVIRPQTGKGSFHLNEYLMRKFREEIDALTRFHHPHIVGILDQGELPDSAPFLVMDFIEGISLSEVMQGKKLGFARVANLMQQIGRALSYAHERHVFHRDLKPGNIMLRTTDGEDFVIVIDFGIATVKEWPHRTRGRGGAQTSSSGTPDYMAPEQILCEPTAASDIWALGVIAYEMLTGQRPFPVPRDESKQALLGELYQLQKLGVRVKPKELRPDLPEAAQPIILKALSFDPQARYQTARDFTETLASALTGQPQTLHSTLANETTAPESWQDTTVPDTTLIREVRPAEVVISYSTEDVGHALRIAEQLKAAGVACWLADHGREAVLNDRSETIKAIRECKAVLLLCSNAALRSASIKQDLQMAWSYERPFLPLLIEPIDFAEQAAYWLEDKQWIEAMNAPPERWLPQVLQSLARVGVHFHDTEQPTLPAGRVIQPIRLNHSLQSLRAIARFTDQIWPLPAERVPRSAARSAVRGLGAPQDDVQHGHRLGSRVCLAIESDRAGHLLLLDEGPEEIIYCLCPSWFAPDTRLPIGRSYLPQAGSRYDSFVVTGKPGREHLLAIVSEEPLGLDWGPTDPRIPARVLKQADIETLLARLRSLDRNQWMALSTYFDVVA